MRACTDGPDTQDTLWAPEGLSPARKSLDAQTWQDGIGHSLQLAEVAPGTAWAWPPCVFLRGLAQGRALEELSRVRSLSARVGTAPEQLVTRRQGDRLLQTFGADAAGNVLFQTDGVDLYEIYAGESAYVDTLVAEFATLGVRSLVRMRRRNLH